MNWSTARYLKKNCNEETKTIWTTTLAILKATSFSLTIATNYESKEPLIIIIVGSVKTLPGNRNWTISVKVANRKTNRKKIAGQRAALIITDEAGRLLHMISQTAKQMEAVVKRRL